MAQDGLRCLIRRNVPNGVIRYRNGLSGRRPLSPDSDHIKDAPARHKSAGLGHPLYGETIHRSMFDFMAMPADDSRRRVQNWDSLDCGCRNFVDTGIRQGNSMETALLVKELRTEYAGPFELNLGVGACAAITGPSGSGKSLFLRMIADLDPNQGEVWLHGTERASLAAPEWRKRATYVSAESGWWADTVSQRCAAHSRSEVAALAARLGLHVDLLDASIARLSTGEKQRLSLVRALLTSQPVLLLDEPTGPLGGGS